MQEEIVSEFHKVEDALAQEATDEEARIKLNARILESKDNLLIMGIICGLIIFTTFFLFTYKQSAQTVYLDSSTVKNQAGQEYSAVANMGTSATIQINQSASTQQVLDLSSLSF